MTTRPFRISERSSGWVGVVRIAVAVFDCDIQINQIVVGGEKTAEDDNSLNRQQFVWIGIILLNPGKQSDQRVLRRLPPDLTGRGSTNQFLSLIREGIQPLLEWFNVALSLQLRSQSQRGFFVQR